MCLLKTKLCILLLYFFLSQHASFAQNDAEASKVLFGAYRQYKTYNNIKMNFEVTIEHKERQLLQTYDGVAYIQGLNHKLELPKEESITNGKTIWTYYKNKKELRITTYDPNDGRLTPDEIFREDFLTRGLRYTLVKPKYNPNDPTNTQVQSIVNNHIIEFTPTMGRRKYFKFQLYIDKVSKLANKWVVFMKNGSTITYDLKITPNVYLAPSFFIYNKTRYPADTKEYDFTK